MLTTAQKSALKADILADPALSAMPQTADGAFAIADVYSLPASPDFWVWRPEVGQAEIVGTTTADGTAWSWPQYITRSQGERDGWREMFADTGTINFAQANVRQGLNDIFSGTGTAPVAQRAHLFTVGRRKATRIEKLLATGAGSTASPATMGFEGALSYQDVLDARAS